jgi:membrane-bound lytic murein transglycosylase D
MVSTQGTKASSAKKVARTASPATKASRKIVYQVKSGDTLWHIGRTYSVSTSHIKRWNNLAENHVLRPGDKLTLMVLDEHRG